MTCREFEQFLYPYLDNEFGPGERLDVERHLAECPDCARKVHLESRFQEELRLKVRDAIHASSQTAPDSLRQGVITGLRRQHRRAQYTSWAKLSAAALVIAMLGGGYWRMRPPARQRFLKDAIRWYVKRLPLESRPGTHEQAEAWFSGKLDHRVSIPRFRRATLDGVRLAQVKDRPAAYIDFAAEDSTGTPGRRVGLFVFDDTERELEALDSSPEVESNAGFQVALWREGEIVYELVTDLDEQDIWRLWKERSSRGPQSPPPEDPPVVAVPRSQLPTLDVQPASLSSQPR